MSYGDYIPRTGRKQAAAGGVPGRPRHRATAKRTHGGRRAGEQVEIIQQTVDTQSAVLDRRAREVEYLQTEVAAEQKRLAGASAALSGDRRQLADQRQQAEQAAGDKGFDDSLKLYS